MNLDTSIGYVERVKLRVRVGVVASGCGSPSSTLIPSVASMGEGLLAREDRISQQKTIFQQPGKSLRSV